MQIKSSTVLVALVGSSVAQAANLQQRQFETTDVAATPTDSNSGSTETGSVTLPYFTETSQSGSSTGSEAPTGTGSGTATGTATGSETATGSGSTTGSGSPTGSSSSGAESTSDSATPTSGSASPTESGSTTSTSTSTTTEASTTTSGSETSSGTASSTSSSASPSSTDSGASSTLPQGWATWMLPFVLGAFLAVILNIVLLTLIQCDITSITVYQLVSLVPGWLSALAYFLLIALIMVPICKRLVQGNRKIAKMVTIVHTIYVVVLGIILLCHLAIYTHLIDVSYRGTLVSASTLRYHQMRLATAYAVLSVIGMLMAAANMLFALTRGHHLRRGVLFPVIILLILSSLGMTVVDLANHIIIDYLQADYIRKGIDAYNRSLEAQNFLGYFFYSVTFLMALLVASSNQLSDNASTGPVKHPQNQQKYPSISQAQQPYRAYRPQGYAHMQNGYQ
ncbi:hypothetical protein P875_00138499 [Aspergillus parasiticus SU-1]|uniref:Uncharacterized protein n=2 Tax=Aspergillus parasiticus TaxID=5067 RepID=A0A0F0IDW5_ASPPU|nr:hypothetical protein P875_00138499 [Aspergillus parasiticus SU-1]